MLAFVSELQHVDDGGPPRCAICGAEAAGPCIRCKQFVCGDCCVLSEGGLEIYALCTRCDRRGGHDLTPGFSALGRTLVLVVVALVGFAAIALLLLR
jgi:hypothetical protein